MPSPKPSLDILRTFAASGEPKPLSGGEDRTYRVGGTVLKRNDEGREFETIWLSDLFAVITESGFQVARPIAASNGEWIVRGWSASHFIEGHHEHAGRVPEAIDAIVRFHEAINSVAKPSFLDADNDVYARADRLASGTRSSILRPISSTSR